MSGERERVLALYRTMTSEQLRLLRAAFTRDREPLAASGDRVATAFVDGRLAWLRLVLDERERV